MDIRFTDLGRLIELWAAWYSIGVDGWLSTDESIHTCSLDLPNPAASNGTASAQPPYPPDPALDPLLLRALNEFGLQCNRLGTLSFSRTSTAEEISRAAEPIVALLEAEHPFFAGKQLNMFSELRREYGDFGSHTMALDLTVQNGHAVIHHSAFEMNNRRRGLKLDLWEPVTNALAAYEEICEQGAALGHSVTGEPADFTEDEPEAEGESDRERKDESAANREGASQEGQANHRFEAASLPFPCLSEAEASRLARLSNQVAPARHASADGAILISTHPLRELAALITFARFCEPMGAMQRV
jgi:hypothetical protein